MGDIIPVRCRCGDIHGEADTAGGYVRATCYCHFCRDYANWLGSPGLLDPAGGSDIVAMAPSRLRFTSGLDRLACATLSSRVYRWYSRCCRTPMGNTPSSPRLHYVGLHTACMPDREALRAAFGPAGRCVINTGSATAPVRARPLAFAAGGLRIVAGIASARMRGQRESPYFDRAGQPVSEPHRAV